MSKKSLKIATLIILIGLSLSVIGTIGVKGDIEAISNIYNQDHLYEEKEFMSQTSKDKNLIIEVKNRILIFSESNDEELKIKYFDSKDDLLIISEGTSTTSITNPIEVKFFNFPMWQSLEVSKMYVSLPKNFTGNINITSINGNIEFSNIEQLNDLTISSTNGSLDISEVNSIDYLSFNAVNGSSFIYKSTVEDMLLTSINGSHKLKDVINHKLDMQTTNGSLYIELIGSPLDYKITTSTVNGKTTFNDLKIENGIHQANGIYSLIVKTVNGSIKIAIKP